MDDLTIFQSYQDDERLIMKGCLHWNPLRLRRFRLKRGSNSGPLDPQASAEPTELLGLLISLKRTAFFTVCV